LKNIFHELKAFRDWTIINRPTSGEIALWYVLLTINNMVGWSDQFTASNPTLQLLTGLSKSSFDRARNKLVQRGLIEYQPGTTRQSGTYRLVSIWNQSWEQPRNQSREQCGSNVRLIRDQSGSNSGDINKHIYNITKQSVYPPDPPAGEDTQKIQYANCVSMTEKEHQELVDLFGEEKTQEWINRLNLWKSSKGRKTHSDYYTILDWHNREKDKQKERAITSGSKTSLDDREIYIPPNVT
jgi:hypothetical protein